MKNNWEPKASGLGRDLDASLTNKPNVGLKKEFELLAGVLTIVLFVLMVVVSLSQVGCSKANVGNQPKPQTKGELIVEKGALENDVWISDGKDNHIMRLNNKAVATNGGFLYVNKDTKRTELVPGGGGSDHKVMGSAGDQVPGFLDAKVDGTTIKVVGDKLVGQTGAAYNIQGHVENGTNTTVRNIGNDHIAIDASGGGGIDVGPGLADELLSIDETGKKAQRGKGFAARQSLIFPGQKLLGGVSIDGNDFYEAGVVKSSNEFFIRDYASSPFFDAVVEMDSELSKDSGWATVSTSYFDKRTTLKKGKKASDGNCNAQLIAGTAGPRLNLIGKQARIEITDKDDKAKTNKIDVSKGTLYLNDVPINAVHGISKLNGLSNSEQTFGVNLNPADQKIKFISYVTTGLHNLDLPYFTTGMTDPMPAFGLIDDKLYKEIISADLPVFNEIGGVKATTYPDQVTFGSSDGTVTITPAGKNIDFKAKSSGGIQQLGTSKKPKQFLMLKAATDVTSLEWKEEEGVDYTEHYLRLPVLSAASADGITGLIYGSDYKKAFGKRIKSINGKDWEEPLLGTGGIIGGDFPVWDSTGDPTANTHILRFPNARDSGVTGGLLSNNDWKKFNAGSNVIVDNGKKGQIPIYAEDDKNHLGNKLDTKFFIKVDPQQDAERELHVPKVYGTDGASQVVVTDPYDKQILKGDYTYNREVKFEKGLKVNDTYKGITFNGDFDMFSSMSNFFVKKGSTELFKLDDKGNLTITGEFKGGGQGGAEKQTWKSGEKSIVIDSTGTRPEIRMSINSSWQPTVIGYETNYGLTLGSKQNKGYPIAISERGTTQDHSVTLGANCENVVSTPDPGYLGVNSATDMAIYNGMGVYWGVKESRTASSPFGIKCDNNNCFMGSTTKTDTNLNIEVGKISGQIYAKTTKIILDPYYGQAYITDPTERENRSKDRPIISLAEKDVNNKYVSLGYGKDIVKVPVYTAAMEGKQLDVVSSDANEIEFIRHQKDAEQYSYLRLGDDSKYYWKIMAMKVDKTTLQPVGEDIFATTGKPIEESPFWKILCLILLVLCITNLFVTHRLARKNNAC